MGLLQRLFGRREEDPDDETGPAPETTDADDEPTRPTPAGGVLGDAAPLPEPASTPDGAPSAAAEPPEDPPEPPGAATRPEGGEPARDADDPDPQTPSDPEAEAPVLLEDDAPLATVLPFRLPEQTGRDEAADEDCPDGEPADGDAAGAADAGPGEATAAGGGEAGEAADDGGDDEAPDEAPDEAADEAERVRVPAAAATGPAGGAPEVPGVFTPSRPRREPLSIDPPKAPAAEQRRTEPGTVGAWTPPKPEEDDFPADTSGSPRAALRAAGVGVPHMQLVTTRGRTRLWAFPVADHEALGWWLEIRRVHERTGWLPVLLGPADGWLDDAEAVLHEGDDELGRLAEVDVEELLHTKAAEAGEPPRGVATLPTRGDSTFTVAKAPGLLGLVQAEHGWQVPALLPWAGSTNWELFGAEHAAVLRRWDASVDIEVVAMSWDVLELYVADPPTDDEAALELAQEVYAYCPDLLAAGVPTLDDLAVHMVKSKAWYFRWSD